MLLCIVTSVFEAFWAAILSLSSYTRPLEPVRAAQRMAGTGKGRTIVLAYLQPLMHFWRGGLHKWTPYGAT
jgi:hypothetical protein